MWGSGDGWGERGGVMGERLEYVMGEVYESGWWQ